MAISNIEPSLNVANVANEQCAHTRSDLSGGVSRSYCNGSGVGGLMFLEENVMCNVPEIVLVAMGIKNC